MIIDLTWRLLPFSRLTDLLRSSPLWPIVDSDFRLPIFTDPSLPRIQLRPHVTGAFCVCAVYAFRCDLPIRTFDRASMRVDADIHSRCGTMILPPRFSMRNMPVSVYFPHVNPVAPASMPYSTTTMFYDRVFPRRPHERLWPDQKQDPPPMNWGGRKLFAVSFRRRYRRSSTGSSG